MSSPPNEVFLVLDSFPQRFPQNELNEVLKFGVNAPPNGILKDCFHPRHQNLKSFDHRDHLNQGELFLVRIVVPRRLKLKAYRYVCLKSVSHD